MFKQVMSVQTSKRDYIRHQYSGPRKSRKRIRGGLRQFHREESRAKVWRSVKTKKMPVKQNIIIDNSTVTPLRTYGRKSKKTVIVPNSNLSEDRPDLVLLEPHIETIYLKVESDSKDETSETAENTHISPELPFKIKEEPIDMEMDIEETRVEEPIKKSLHDVILESTSLEQEKIDHIRDTETKLQITDLTRAKVWRSEKTKMSVKKDIIIYNSTVTQLRTYGRKSKKTVIVPNSNSSEDGPDLVLLEPHIETIYLKVESDSKDETSETAENTHISPELPFKIKEEPIDMEMDI